MNYKAAFRLGEQQPFSAREQLLCPAVTKTSQINLFLL